MAEDESFVEGFITMEHPALKGRASQIDKNIGRVRGGNARTGLPFTMDRLQTRMAAEGNKATVVDRAKKDLGVARDLYEDKGVKDRPTTVSTISNQFEKLFNSAVGRSIDEGGPIRGTAWYFDMRRKQQSEVDPAASLNKRQLTAMGGRLSSSKTPEDERVSLGGISSLVSSQQDKVLNGKKVRDIPSTGLAEITSNASSWNAFDNTEGGTAPSASRPDFGGDEDLKSAVVRAGRAHTANVAGALQVGRGEVSPKSLYNASTTPKTAAYAEMQAQSDPDSDVEVDARNISAHYKNVAEGTQSKDQGMFMFSQEKAGPRAYALDPKSPAPIDTWMVAAGSGQPLSSRRVIIDKRGRKSNRQYSPAKRLVDKDFPLSPGAYGKRRLGIEDTPKEITPEALVSAQHNKALERVSNRIGAVSFDQFGNNIQLPKSLLQETIWTETRIQAGEDPEYKGEQEAKQEQEKATQSKQLQYEKDTKNNLKNQGTLF